MTRIPVRLPGVLGTVGAVVLSLVGAVALTAGCAPDRRPTTGRYLDVPADRIAVEVFRTDKLVMLERTQGRLRAGCLAKRGFHQLSKLDNPEQPDPFADLNVTAPDFAARSEDDARRFGFGWNEPAQSAHIISSDPAFDRAFDQCGNRAAQTIDPEFPRLRSRAYNLINKINVETTRASLDGPAAADFDRMTAPLLDCLDRHGFHGASGQQRSLDSYGVGRPTGRLTGPEPAPPRKIPGTVEVLPPVPERTYLPTSQESALAVVTVRCAREIGYGDSYVAHRLGVLRTLLTTYESEIHEVTSRIEEMFARLR